MSRYVVDASVAIKWFLPEPDDAAAKVLIAGGHDLIVPSLLLAEIGNIAWKRFRRGELTNEDAEAILSGIGALRLEWRPLELYASAALEIACRLGRTFYDSLYLALAVTEDAPMITADERLYNAVATTALSSSVILLANMP